MADRLFEGEEAVLHAIERIVAPLGLRVDVTSPWVDARLPDGSWVHAIVSPLSLCGPRPERAEVLVDTSGLAISALARSLSSARRGRGPPVRPVPGGDAETGDPVHRLTALRAVQDKLPKRALVSPRTPRSFLRQ